MSAEVAGSLIVWGGVVTHEPDPERLRSCVRAAACQVAHLFVFDNGSANVSDVRTVLSDEAPSADLVESRDNQGLAVALNELASRAREAGATHLLLLDQDSVASANLVAELCRHVGPRVGICCPLVRERVYEEVAYDSDRVLSVRRCITSGSLMCLDAWEAAGGYDERLFVDWVDTAFCDALRVAGYRIVKTLCVSVEHELGSPELVGWGPGKDYTETMRWWRPYYRQNHAPWRWHDRGRSQAIIIGTYRTSLISLEEVGLLLRSVGRVVLLERDKRARLSAFFSGLAEGRSVLKAEVRP